MEDLRGRVVVVTGASRGLGAGLAARFAELGGATGLCARSRIAPLSSTARTFAAAVDVADAGAVDAFAVDVVAELGPIDLWINNAGALGEVVELRDLDPASAGAVVATNLLGALHGMQSFVRHRHTVGGGGVLVNISFGAANGPHRGLGAYCATKAAVQMLTDVVNDEERPTGLRAYAVEPGAVDTDMQASLRAAADRFPDVRILRQLHEAGLLTPPRQVVDRIAALGVRPGTTGARTVGRASGRRRVQEGTRS